ncbi:V-type ATPase 116kDa subunit family protein (plasmid) [Bacillus sp. S3]|uniref:V-type ATPase 116kDa subunit family protein n=1 Tax=Bacillus sp. S3 TaxID=486398 RepID=UPI001188FAC9|nr:V-type ATPase 116kDa subunit family protein [Bacillus sp. S3]QCJ45448.1 V-type ATPase 116kDa subunit family protein [Bacillus sp. S3]
MAKSTQKKVKKSAAAELMEKFIEDGKYPELKQSEVKIKRLTTSVKEKLEKSDSKRHEFKEFDMVGRFTAKKVYETDYIGLNEYLYDVGLLLQVVEIDNKAIQSNELYMDMIQDFKLPDTFYLKPNFNKVGKELNKIPSSFEIAEHWCINDLVKELAILKPKVKQLNSEYDHLKRRLLRLPEFQNLITNPKLIREPIPHKFGSLSLIANQSKYDIPAIYDYIGEWMLIEYGKPSSELIDRFILTGTISKKDIEQFRRVVDIRLEFSVMTLEDEKKILEMMDNKNRTTTANRVGA